MKKEEAVSAAHLIQAAKLGNTKADSILRTGKNNSPKWSYFSRYRSHSVVENVVLKHCTLQTQLLLWGPI